MSFFQLFYQLIFGPLELLFEMVFGTAYEVTGNLGLSIIPLSLCINFLLLPLYNRADSIQKEERERQNKMSAGVEHIKKTFKGDERYMMLKAYYRVNSYKPVYALRSTLPLVLEIPFFIAAYHFLSHLSVLNVACFGPVQDLSYPDSLINIGNLHINILPILMTLINFVSSYIYSRGYSKKEKFQLYGMALIFLVLLYNSPSGLVIYWTLNNLFSLCKNLIYTSKAPERNFSIFSSLIGLVFLGFAFTEYLIQLHMTSYIVVTLTASLLFFIPSIKRICSKTFNTGKDIKQYDMKKASACFISAVIFLAVLNGLLIPSSVIKSSPSEFIILNDYMPSLYYVLTAFCTAVGTYIVWFGLVYYLLDNRSRKIFAFGLTVLSVDGLINYLLFGTRNGNISPNLIYYNKIPFSKTDVLLNLSVLVVLALAFAIIWNKASGLLVSIVSVLIASMFILSIKNSERIIHFTPNIIQIDDSEIVERDTEDMALFSLSKTGRNVIVFMLDRAVGVYVPYIMNERPELIEQFDGFTFYPNTLSYGNCTNIGCPSLFGGYEYTPEAMNERNDLPLAQKHDEALKVMPVLFSEAGFKVTVLDPPYAGYHWKSDLTIYSDYDSIDCYGSTNGEYKNYAPNQTIDQSELDSKKKITWTRNLFCFSLMKSCPLFVQNYIYDSGYYFSTGRYDKESYTQIRNGTSQATGMSEDFINSYGALCALPYMTDVTDDEKGAFLMLQNDTSHNEVLLKEPEYEPALYINNREYDSTHTDRFVVDGREMSVETAYQMAHYHVNMAALLKVGEWLDYLKELGVYDNTRIIIVSDHGVGLGQFDSMVFGQDNRNFGLNIMDGMFYNPLLMVKDFNSTGFGVDYTFMTNADTPTLALSGIVENPVNPFTGNAINSDKKGEDVQYIFCTTNFNPEYNNGNTFTPDAWFALRNHNVLDGDNWEYLGDY